MFSFMRFSFAVLCTGLFLTACGGGGGGGSRGTQMDPMGPHVEPTPTFDSQTAFEGSGERPALTPQSSRTAISGRLQQGEPAFGSVAMNLYSPGLAPVRSAETTFTGNRFTLSVRRQDGTGFTLDSDRHYTETVSDGSTSINPVTNRPAASGYILDATGTRFALAGAGVEWSNADYTDYLAAGYWMAFDANTNAVEMGGFIDGPDYSLDMTPSLPISGTATYRGAAGGLYVAVGGSDADVPGATEIGEYDGRLNLTADFGTMQIHGRVDQIVAGGGLVELPNGMQYISAIEDSDIEMIFRPVPITQNGTFGEDNVEFTSRTIPITSSAGSWAGQFSNVNDANGNPRAAAGTNTGYLETAGGSRAVLTGAFYGATERFE